jgi:hypothetical protein
LRWILDAGAFVALERRDPVVWAALHSAMSRGDEVLSHGGVVGQVWRGRGSRQAMLSKALQSVDIRPLTEALGRLAGELLAAAGQKDVIDAAVVLLAADGDRILTSDPKDLRPLVAATGRAIDLVVV